MSNRDLIYRCSDSELPSFQDFNVYVSVRVFQMHLDSTSTCQSDGNINGEGIALKLSKDDFKRQARTLGEQPAL